MTLKNRCTESLYLSYEKNTRQAYDNLKAISYHRAQTKSFSWMRFTTWRQRKIIDTILEKLVKRKDFKVFDIPCGTGIMTDIITKHTTNLISADISDDMLLIAKNNYPQGEFNKQDILELSSINQSFDLVLVVGILHRLPVALRRKVIENIVLVSKKYIIITFSTDHYYHRVKRFILTKILSNYKPAPSPMKYSTLIKELCIHSLKIIDKKVVFPFLSSEIVLLLSKNNVEV